MSEFAQRFEQGPLFADHHERIRNLEALVSTGGSDPTVCPDCVLDPFTVNPGDIFVPPAYRNCVDIAGSVEVNPVQECGTGNVFVVSSMPAGYCSGFGLGTALGLQVRAQLAFGCIGVGPYGPASNMSNIIIYVGNPETQVASVTWPVAGLPGNAPCDYDTGWIDVSAPCSPSCTAMTASLSFQSHSTFTGGCGSGNLGIRWVALDEEGDYRGALDDLPQADSDGDVIYFSSETNEFTTGPARRRTSYFMG